MKMKVRSRRMRENKEENGKENNMKKNKKRKEKKNKWVWPISPFAPRPASRHSLGSWVLLPEPVSPATITTWWSRMSSTSSSRRAVMGRSAG